MEEKTDSSQKISIAEALKTQIVVNQALVNLLIEKGLFSREELLENVRAIKKEMEEAIQFAVDPEKDTHTKLLRLSFHLRKGFHHLNQKMRNTSNLRHISLSDKKKV